MLIYHFTDSDITVFKHTKPKRGYSQATGKGIYFTTDYAKGAMKYGVSAKYCYICEFEGSQLDILDLGAYDSMYFEGDMIHSSSLVTENFRRYFQGVAKIPEPEIQIEHISSKALRWLKKRGIKAIKGMDDFGYACPEFCVLEPSSVKILNRLNMI